MSRLNSSGWELFLILASGVCFAWFMLKSSLIKLVTMLFAPFHKTLRGKKVYLSLYSVVNNATNCILFTWNLDYRLVIICSNEEEEKSHFISKLHLYRRPFIPKSDIQEYKKYLAIHFTHQTREQGNFFPASVMDFEQYVLFTSHWSQLVTICLNLRSCVRFVTADRSGMGKSLYVKRLAEKLKNNFRQTTDLIVQVTIPLHGPVVTSDTVLELLKDHIRNPTCCIYHIDIAPNVSYATDIYCFGGDTWLIFQVLWQVDTVLFSLLILRGLTDSQGRVWRCHHNQLYAVEVSFPNRDHIAERDKKFVPESQTMSLIKVMPSVSCPSPRKVLDHLTADNCCAYTYLSS